MHANILTPLSKLFRKWEGSITGKALHTALLVSRQFLMEKWVYCHIFQGCFNGPEAVEEVTQCRYSDVIMGTVASQITILMNVYSSVNSGAYKKHQSSASLSFVWGIDRWPVNSPHKWPVTRKLFPSDDVITTCKVSLLINRPIHNCDETRWILLIFRRQINCINEICIST